MFAAALIYIGNKSPIYLCVCTCVCACVCVCARVYVCVVKCVECMHEKKFCKKLLKNLADKKQVLIFAAQTNKKPNNLNLTIMEKKISNVYRVANKCGFSVKHRETPENVVFAFKPKDSELNLFFEVKAQKSENAKIFAENVAHEVFLFSENIDPHTETRKYLEKIGGTLAQYTEIYSQINSLEWQIRQLWFSL